MRARSVAVWIAALLLLPPAGAASDDPFPEYESIRGNVAFWRSVWSEWSLGQVAIHDKQFPALVYEVTALPGPTGEAYTAEQRQFIDRLREFWEERLKVLEQSVDAGQELTAEQKELALRIATTAGNMALDGAHTRVRVQRGLRERFRRGLEISFRYDAAFREILRAEGVPEDLAYLPHVESSFQPAARSSAGAVGVWQFTRGTGRKFLRVNSTIDERLDPIAAARGAARYLIRAYEQLGSWPIAVTSYNHGVDGMLRAVQAHGADYEAIYRDYHGRGFGFASSNFYSEFLAAREVARKWSQYFPEGLQPEPPLDLDRVTLDRGLSPAAIARKYGVPLDALAQLNPAWSSRAVRSGTALPLNTTVWLPTNTLAGNAVARPAPPAPVSPSASGSSTYVVQRGDTLSGIATRHGLTLAALRALNGLGPRDTAIRVGQTLSVAPAAAPTSPSVALSEPSAPAVAGPVPPARSHVVRRGDTLSRIARTYRVPLADLLAANGLSGDSTIHPGQTLAVPATR